MASMTLLWAAAEEEEEEGGMPVVQEDRVGRGRQMEELEERDAWCWWWPAVTSLFFIVTE